MRLILTLLCVQMFFNPNVEASYLQDETHVRLHNHARDVYKNLSKLVILELKSCKVDSIVLFYNESPGVDPILNEISTHFKAPIIYYNIKNYTTDDVTNNLYKFYTHLKQTFFILMGKDTVEILNLAESIFQARRRRQAALMPHKAKWLFWILDSAEETRLVRQQEKSDMDNVGVIRIKLNESTLHHGKEEFPESFELYTYVWTKTRSKRIEFVKSENVGRNCTMFPNSKYGMNRRQLDVLGLVYLSPNYLNLGIDSKTGKHTFKGFRIQLLKVLSQSLNFTYNVTIVNNSVRNYLDEMKNQKADIGLSMWSKNKPFDEIDVTYPVHLEALRGMYLNQPLPLSLENMPTSLLAPFPYMAYLYIPAAIFFTSAVWIFIWSFAPNNNHNTTHSANKCNIGRHGTLNHRTCSTSKVVDFMTIIWALVSSVLNQNAIPDTNLMSCRILAWSWRFCLVLFYAIFTGFLTSQMVRHPKIYPFKTFKGLLANKEYEWGTLQDDMKMKDLLNNSSDTVLSGLGDYLHILDDTDCMNEVKERLLKRLEDRFVFIYYESYISTIVNAADFIVIPEGLVAMNRGLAVSKDSELNSALSIAIMRAHESGIINRLLRKFEMDLQHNTTRIRKIQRRGNQSINVKEALSLLLMILCLTVLSTVVLLIELFLSSDLVNSFLQHARSLYRRPTRNRTA